jgi:hypothetical protein
MAIMNRRNAFVGWLTLKAGKVIVRRKVKDAGGRLASWRSPGDERRSTRKDRSGRGEEERSRRGSRR